ncbi:MAG TPA: aldolase/citrate lyase family protein [Candidatus Methylomirabilis sp.]|nr:aldolase/citrate lyase family protein [Candidatus Methylomirabilis sp.]
MRANSLKRKLTAGQRVCGVLIEFNNAELFELFGHLGYDFVFIDGQHCGMGVETARAMMRAADLTGMTSIVRVPKNDPAIILEYLDAGAGGIVVPNIVSRADAEGAVAAMKYPPIGQRGGFGRSRAANFGITQSQVEYFTKMNDEVLFVPLIEDQSALPHLAAICSTPGVDVVLIGPGDMALSMGIPGGWKDPRVQAAVEQIRAAAAAAGKPTMLVALDPADGRELYAQGFRALMVSAVGLLVNSGANFLKEIGRR